MNPAAAKASMKVFNSPKGQIPMLAEKYLRPILMQMQVTGKLATQPRPQEPTDNAPEPRVDGGPVVPGKQYLVGEKQPETLVNADGTQQVIGQSGPQVITAKQPGMVAPSTDYDMTGYVKKYGQPDQSKGQHLTDEFKLPNHITFSKDSSYSKPGQEGGDWAKNPDGSWTFYASEYNLKNYSPEQLQAYFLKFEPGNKLVLPSRSAK
jgi:hypothetical protein